ncbi:hypothetical protein FLA4_01940 [Candidatus Rickettsia kotlanii]|nr:hypothetical protein FLA4_01940 [Candidatus Rickettsia kotlanii]BDU61026.1 hypothetical protein HM2_01940 [Candidatus Rickettsia kotlanii]
MQEYQKKCRGYTINKVCGSGLKSVALAANSIMTGDNEIVIAGGQENMSLGMHGNYISEQELNAAILKWLI